MIVINLLPHREWARKKRKDEFTAHVVLALLVGAAISAAVYAGYSARIQAQQQRNEFIQAEIRKLDAQIKDVRTLQQEIQALQARQVAVEGLQAERNLPVHLLDEMVRQLPDGVFLRTLKQDGKAIALTGVAQSQERVSELLRNLGQNSAWLKQPHLLEISAATLALTQRDQRRVFNFSMRVTLTDGPAGAAPSAGPTGAAPAAARSS